MELVEGLSKDQYSRLWSYARELPRSNKDSSIVIAVNKPSLQVLPTLERIYVYFDGCKKGFVKCCRPLIGLDGCFLKGTHCGQLLVAIAKDGNNCMFPIAFAMVESET